MKNVKRKLSLKSESIRALSSIGPKEHPATTVSKWSGCDPASGCHSCICLPPA